jgi:hypothetical protein
MAFPYEPQVTVVQSPLEDCEIVLSPENAAGFARHTAEAMIAQKEINPWCGICRAPRERWIFKDEVLAFDSLEEAVPVLIQCAIDQAATRRFFKGSHD